MALQKTMIPLEFESKGLTSTIDVYWKIVSLGADLINKSSSIQLHGYASELAKTDKKDPIEVRNIITQEDTYVFDLENLENDGMNPVKYAYLQLKKSEFFVDSIDV